MTSALPPLTRIHEEVPLVTDPINDYSFIEDIPITLSSMFATFYKEKARSIDCTKWDLYHIITEGKLKSKKKFFRNNTIPDSYIEAFRFSSNLHNIL